MDKQYIISYLDISYRIVLDYRFECCGHQSHRHFKYASASKWTQRMPCKVVAGNAGQWPYEDSPNAQCPWSRAHPPQASWSSPVTPKIMHMVIWYCLKIRSWGKKICLVICLSAASLKIDTKKGVYPSSISDWKQTSIPGSQAPGTFTFFFSPRRASFNTSQGCCKLCGVEERAVRKSMIPSGNLRYLWRITMFNCFFF